MRKGTILALVVVAMSLTGCKKQVPTDIVQKNLRSMLRLHLPNTASAMCGTAVKGITNASISNVQRKPDGTSGTAHISGAPFAVTPGAPSNCEGDVAFRYSSTSRTTGSRKRKTTTTTWYLEEVTLTAVQTKGVAFKKVDEKGGDDDDDAP